MDKILAPIKQRVLEIPIIKGITKKKFFEDLEVSSSNFRTNSLKSEVGGDVIAKILSIHDDISSEWLLLGIGEPLKTNILNEDTVEYQTATNGKSEQMILHIAENIDQYIANESFNVLLKLADEKIKNIEYQKQIEKIQHSEKKKTPK